MDENIAAQIRSTLERNALTDHDSLGVKVENGLVTLSGTVENWAARDAAYHVSVFTNGVVDVDNRIKVK